MVIAPHKVIYYVEGIENWSGVAYKNQNSPFKNSYIACKSDPAELPKY